MSNTSVPITASVVSNSILYLANTEGVQISPMKLQKLLYFVYREHLKNTRNPLFPERFEVWKYGPVISSVYDEFKNYKDKPIKDYSRDCNGKGYMITEGSFPAFQVALNKVWQKYKDFSGITLSNITHERGSAWRKAWEGNKPLLLDDDILHDDTEGIN